MENIVYGYVTLALLGEQPVLDQLTLVVDRDRFDEARVRSVAERVRARLEAEGHPVRRTDVPKPGGHPHADLMGTLLLGAAATAVAAPLGVWGGRVLCRYMAVFLNFDIASFAVPAWVYLLTPLAGLMAPLAAAAWPVARGTRVPVREALAEYGVARNGFGTTAFDRKAFDEHMLMIDVFLLVMSGILAAVSGLGLMTTMSLNVQGQIAEAQPQ
jgi:hypothetical protein